MSIRTTLVALTNILKGVPKALHISSLADAIEADWQKDAAAASRAYHKAIDSAHAAYTEASTKIEAAIEDEVDVAKTMIEGAYKRIKALEEAGLLDIEKSEFAQRIERAYKDLFGIQ